MNRAETKIIPTEIFSLNRLRNRASIRFIARIAAVSVSRIARVGLPCKNAAILKMIRNMMPTEDRRMSKEIRRCSFGVAPSGKNLSILINVLVATSITEFLFQVGL
jgi:hypothetical protein